MELLKLKNYILCKKKTVIELLDDKKYTSYLKNIYLIKKISQISSFTRLQV